jgi:biopolymer transport protein ExbD
LISLTPLIDVVFILLVFFMLASSFLDWRAIDLDTPAQTASQTSLEGAILVEVRRDGLRLSGRSVDRAQLASQVAERLETRPDRPVLVKPADGVVLQEAVDVLDRLTAAGVTELSLIRGPAG